MRRAIHRALLAGLALLAAPGLRADRPRDNLEIPEDLPGAAATRLERAHAEYTKAWEAQRGRDGLFESAIAELEEVTQDEELADVHLGWFYLGSAYNQLRQPENAIEPLEKAVTLKDGFYQGHTLLAEVLATEALVDKALEHYDQALDIWPAYRRALKGKAESLVRLGRFEEAMAFCRKAAQRLDDPEEEPGPYLMSLLGQLQIEVKGTGWDDEYVHESDNYRVLTSVSQDFAEEIAQHAELIRRAYMQVFPDIPRPPRKYVIVAHRNEKAYHEAGGPPQAAGHYSPLLRKLVVYKHPKMEDTTLVLYHEAFHQFLHEYLDIAPQWFNEGLGDYFGPFEYVRRGKREIMRSRPNPWRLRLVKQAMRRGLTPEPSELMLMTREEMYGRRAGINYATAWSLVYFMLEEGTYGKVLVTYFHELRKGRTTNVAYQRTFGRIDMGEFEKDWRNYILGKVEAPRPRRRR